MREIEQQINDVFEGNDPAVAMRSAAHLQAILLGNIMDAYYNQKLRKKDAVNAMARIQKMTYDGVLRMESKLMVERAAQYGYETLTTDTTGGRSADWFNQTGKAFATGVASTCVACAIINPDIGMAASHRNMVTMDNVVRIYDRGLDDRQFVQQLERGANLYDIMIPPNTLRQVVDTAMNEAFNQFQILAPGGMPYEGNIVMMSGMDWATPDKIDFAINAGMQTLKHRVSTEGKLKGQKGLTFYQELGKDGGIIYGGKGHPDYNRPQIYSFK